MSKYLKLFKNESDYQTFRGGGEWITPNVSLIETNSSGESIPQIIYHKYEPIIHHMYITMSNTIYDIIYEEGMTWGEWINSEYNIHPTTNTTPWLRQSGPTFVEYDGLILVLNYVVVYLDEYIIENENYELSNMT